jgi:hypothetical protein
MRAVSGLISVIAIEAIEATAESAAGTTVATATEVVAP